VEAFRRKDAVPIAALVAIIVIQHTVQYLINVTPKLYPFVQAFESLESGRLWFHGTLLSVSDIRIGGPLYKWVHYPLAGLRLPYYSLHVMYAALEALALLIWLAWGRRFFSTRQVLWGGLFLANSNFGKLETGESSLFLMVLPMLVFLGMLRALERRGLAAYLFPAVLWGVALQFHISALFIIPAVALACWRAGDRRLGRLLLVGIIMFIAGVIPAFGGVLFQEVDWGSFGALSKIVASERNPGVILLSIAVLLRTNIFALGGLVLLARQRPWSARQVLIMLWFILPLALVLALDPDDFKPWHYVILVPAYMVLSGLCVDRLTSRLARTRLFSGRLRHLLRLDVIIAIFLVHSCVEMVFIYQAALDEEPDAPPEQLPCEVVNWTQTPTFFNPMLDAVKARFRPGDQRKVRFSGLSHDHLAGALWWETRGARLDFWTEDRDPASREVVVALPLDLMSKVPARRRLLPSKIFYMVEPTAVTRLQVRRGRLRASSAPFSAPPAARYALVHLEGDLGFDVTSLRIESGSQKLEYAERVVCCQWGRYVGQFMFDLSRIGDREKLILELRHRAGVINYLYEIVFF